MPPVLVLIEIDNKRPCYKDIKLKLSPCVSDFIYHIISFGYFYFLCVFQVQQKVFRTLKVILTMMSILLQGHFYPIYHLDIFFKITVGIMLLYTWNNIFHSLCYKRPFFVIRDIKIVFRFILQVTHKGNRHSFGKLFAVFNS